MGFGKLFSKEGKSETRRSSTLSKISNWSHKQTNKRNSQPSPAVSYTSLHHSRGMSHNPFETNSPVTPSESMRNVDEFVNPIRTSFSSSFGHSASFEHVVSPTFYEPEEPEFQNVISQSEQDLHNELRAVALQLDTMNSENAIEIKHRINNVNTSLLNALNNSSQLQSKLTSVISTSKETIVFLTKENEELKEENSNGLAELNEQQVENEELKKTQQQVMDENTVLKEQCKSVLGQQIKLVDIKSELKDELTLVEKERNELQKRIDELEYELNTVEKERNELKEQFNTTEKERNELQDQFNTTEKERNELQDQFNAAEKERNELQDQFNTVEKERNEFKNEFKELNKLFDKNMNYFELKKEINSMVEMKREFMTKEQEINALKMNIKSMEEKYQDLIKKSENDERQYQSEIKTSGDLTNQVKEQYNAVLAKEELKLEACTTQIRDLMRYKDKSTKDINKIVQENIGLKASLKTVTEENIGLKEQTEQSKQEVNDLKLSSNEAALSIMNKNELLESRVNDIEKNENKLLKELQVENNKLKKIVENMNKPVIEKDQDDIMRTHTKAQLVLIEYLEGQDDVIQAMAKFKKQLEKD